MEPLLSTQAVHRHRVGLGVLVVAALLAHLLIFSGLPIGWPAPREKPSGANAVQVRVVEAVAVAAVPLIEMPLPLPTPTVLPVARRPHAARVPALPAAPVEAIALTVVAPAPASAAAAMQEAVHEADATPIYPTRLPPALVLRYVLSRGALRGTGELTWKPEADHYELRLAGSVAGLALLTQLSSGGFDAAGVAPVRFTDQRLRRGTKAANFQRAAGKITFSGPATEFALREGAQDRLSWMVQLGAIVAADGRLREAGARVALYVVGANGDASVWAFDGVGTEPVATGEGTVSALKFVREPREPYDTQVQVWIDPTHHYLPVRATQKSGPDDEGFELRLQSSGPVP